MWESTLNRSCIHVDTTLQDGVYELVPATEEITQESEVNVVQANQEDEPGDHFEQEGKHRSIT